MSEINDLEWYELVKNGEDTGWKLVWERVVEPESNSMRSSELMRKYSITAGDLMGMLYNEMIGRKKIELYRKDGSSFEGWLRTYVRGFVLNANPMREGEMRIEDSRQDDEGNALVNNIPQQDFGIIHDEVWGLTHYCFRELWNTDPEKAYIHILKTKFYLSSEEIRDFLDISSVGNVDQIFSRSVKFMRDAWARHDVINRK